MAKCIGWMRPEVSRSDATSWESPSSHLSLASPAGTTMSKEENLLTNLGQILAQLSYPRLWSLITRGTISHRWITSKDMQPCQGLLHLHTRTQNCRLMLILSVARERESLIHWLSKVEGTQHLISLHQWLLLRTLRQPEQRQMCSNRELIVPSMVNYLQLILKVDFRQQLPLTQTRILSRPESRLFPELQIAMLCQSILVK